MAGKERGLFKLILKHFFAGIRPKISQNKLIGEDYYGTKYYEVYEKSSLKKKPSRYFVPVNKDDHEQELPVEWESWLRHRRRDPPTLDEIKENYKMQMTKKENAAKISTNYSSKELEEPRTFMQRKINEFPSYEEYKEHGQNYKITDGK